MKWTIVTLEPPPAPSSCVQNISIKHKHFFPSSLWFLYTRKKASISRHTGGASPHQKGRLKTGLPTKRKPGKNWPVIIGSNLAPEKERPPVSRGKCTGRGRERKEGKGRLRSGGGRGRSRGEKGRMCEEGKEGGLGQKVGRDFLPCTSLFCTLEPLLICIYTHYTSHLGQMAYINSAYLPEVLSVAYTTPKKPICHKLSKE